MSPSRFHLVPQPVFPNQRNDEKVFVFSRRHFIDYLFFAIILSVLAIIPIVVLPLILTGTFNFSILNDVYSKDIIILVAASYYLILDVVFLTSWVIHYYDAIIITDERIVEITQAGLFSRKINELEYGQIEDVVCKITGFLSTIFEVGDIEIQTAGPEKNFVMRRVSQPYVTVEIIVDLAAQAKRGVSTRDRLPDLATIGVINGQLIARGETTLPIMNFEKDLQATTRRFAVGTDRPRSLREKFDCWWTGHCNQMRATFGAGATREQETQAKLRDEKDKPEPGGDKMVDL